MRFPLATTLGVLLLAGCGPKGAQPGFPRHDALSRAEFNRWALREDLPVFWVSDANHDGQVQPGEVASLLFFPEAGPWVEEGRFTARFEQAYAGMVAASRAAAAGGSGDDERQRLVGEDLDQGRSTLVATDLSSLDARGQAFVDQMLRVAGLVDQLYSLQAGASALAGRVPADDPASRSLFRRNWGPECVAPRTEGNPACSAIPGAPKRRVDAYPADLQEDGTFCAALEQRADAASLLGSFSVVRSEAGRLKAVPYAVAYAEPMRATATALDAAAAALDPATEQPLATYLKAAAAAFRDNGWQRADEAWVRMNAGNSRWYVRVGPDETYWDPCGRKAAFHLTFAQVDRGSLEWQAKLAPLLPEMERRVAALAGAPYRPRKVSFHLPDFVQVVFNAGSDRAPFGAMVGESLPNWGPIASQGRGRTVAMTNYYQDADSRASRQSQLASLLDAASLALYADDGQADLLDTILHEATHNLGPTREHVAGGRKDAAVFGGPVASVLEELKAETGALYFLGLLRQHGLVDDQEVLHGYAYWASWALGHVSQGMRAGSGQRKTYGNVAAIQLGLLLDAGALAWDRDALAANGADRGALALRPEKMAAAVESMMRQVAGIKARGDTAAAQALFDRYVESGEVVPHAVIAERMLREPRASFVYAIRR